MNRAYDPSCARAAIARAEPLFVSAQLIALSENDAAVHSKQSGRERRLGLEGTASIDAVGPGLLRPFQMGPLINSLRLPAPVHKVENERIESRTEGIDELRRDDDEVSFLPLRRHPMAVAIELEQRRLDHLCI